jgi:L-seryl-tRNA(Ser) seleniumtransferase
MTPKATVEDRNAELRRLPSVERLAIALDELPHHLAVAAARAELAAARREVLAGGPAPELEALASAAAARGRALGAPSLRPAINATGVVVHTNLGRAPLPAAAAEAVAAIAGRYCNLEYDLESGERGSRGAHVEPLLRELSGAEAALAVNNNAAAVMLALAALAGEGEVLVSRGELVEIGGSFRIPDILAHSGATLVEVGTTNRTRREDYERAIGPRTGAILRVHRSNFAIVGFAEEPGPGELAALASEHGIPLIHDLGSGAIEEVRGEPTVPAALMEGADLVCCSADKLLGGPQAGLLLGREKAVERCRRLPLARAMRLDKLQLAALEATLIAHRDGGREAIPVLAMIDVPAEALERRARAMAEAIGEAAEVRRDAGAPGGGSLPAVRLEGPVCSIDPGPGGADALLARLRGADVPVIARILDGRVVLDPRTMSDEEAAEAAAIARDGRG